MGTRLNPRSTSTRRPGATIALLLLALGDTASSTTNADAGASLIGFELQSLRSGERVDLRRYRGRPIVLTFFEPGCSWCLEQLRDFDRLQRARPEALQVVAIGLDGSARQLRRFALRAQPEFPLLRASDELLKSIGGVIGTPYSLVGDEDGRFRHKLIGYHDLEQLLALFPLAP